MIKAAGNSKEIYLHLAIAKSGYCSRRKAEKLVREGMVKVNGEIILKPELKINPAKDTIFIDGKKIDIKEERIYFLLNKPKGVLSAALDERGQKTVVDFLPRGVKTRVYPVGRLDKDTTGLLILSNDGDLTFRLTHPNYKVLKTYLVLCDGEVKKSDIRRLEEGIEIDGKKTLPAKIEDVKFDRRQNRTSLTIEIFEGRKRQVKNMFLAVKHAVVELERIKYAGLTLGDLKRGEVRRLTEAEVKHLKQKAGLVR